MTKQDPAAMTPREGTDEASCDQSANAPVRRRLAGLAAFADMFQDPGFWFGTWAPPVTRAYGVTEFGWFRESDGALAFEQAMYDLGWIMKGFDWGGWKATPEAKALTNNPALLMNASVEDLGRMLTTLVRGERFCTGSLAQSFDDGVLTAIALRARALLDEPRS